MNLIKRHIFLFSLKPMHIPNTQYQNKKYSQMKLTSVYFDNKICSNDFRLSLLTKYIVIHYFPILNFWANNCPIQQCHFPLPSFIICKTIFDAYFFSFNCPLAKISTHEKFIKDQFTKISTCDMQFFQTYKN